MKRMLCAVAAISALSNYAVPAYAQDCDAILVNQISWENTSESQFRSWLQMIDERSYSVSQQKAGGSAYGGMFSGNYESFKDKRSSYLRNESRIEDIRLAREAFKSSLMPEQVSAWLTCTSGKLEFAVTYENVDTNGATIVLNWPGGSMAGPMRDLSSSFDGVQVAPDIASLGSFDGRRSFIVKRSAPNSAIRGTVSGKAGVGPTSLTANVYVPSMPITNTVDIIPKRMMLSLNGRVLTSTAYWSGTDHHQSWDCITSPEDSEMVVLETRDDWLGRRRGACVGPGSFCDSHREGCSDKVVLRGCTVSREWHEWYKGYLTKVGLTYSREAVCDPNARQGA